MPGYVFLAWAGLLSGHLVMWWTETAAAALCGTVLWREATLWTIKSGDSTNCFAGLRRAFDLPAPTLPFPYWLLS